MSPEVVGVAIVCALRPTAFAATYALVSAPAPRRLLVAYIVVGLLWSISVGVIVVSVLHGVRIETGNSTTTAIIELVGGGAALGFAAGMAAGRFPRDRDGAAEDSRVIRELRDPSLAVAAGAGVATHLPGLLYLLGLNEIAAGEPSLVAGMLRVLFFNAIWYAIPFTALLLCVRHPEATRAALGRITAWTRRYGRLAVIAGFFIVGAYFAVKGVVELAG